MEKVRIGIVGLGVMGKIHKANLQAGKVTGLELTAICDQPAVLPEPEEGISQFSDASELIHSGAIDALLIATPHFFHTTIGIEALRAGLHVLVEKPLSVHKADCEKLIAAHQGAKQVFAAMFNQRTDPAYRKLKDLIQSGDLGTIRRIHWTVTDWYRTNSYYKNGGWRATWKGEGGGVLMNQCPHHLDLFQWLFGMPESVHGFCQFGRYHPIEVEDDVTAFFRYADGTTATFITSTGEAPGSNRLEVIAEQGLVTVVNGGIRFLRNRTQTAAYTRESKELFGKPEAWDIEIPVVGEGLQHVGILQNFTDAILKGEPLISPAAEGIYSVELANAILLSAWEGVTIALPMDGERYAKELERRM